MLGAKHWHTCLLSRQNLFSCVSFYQLQSSISSAMCTQSLSVQKLAISVPPYSIVGWCQDMSDWTWLVYLQSAPLASDNSHRTNKYLRNKHLQSVLLHIKLVSEYIFETFVWSFSCIKWNCFKISSHTFAQNNYFWWSWLILRIDCVLAFILTPSTFIKRVWYMLKHSCSSVSFQ